MSQNLQNSKFDRKHRLEIKNYIFLSIHKVYSIGKLFGIIIHVKAFMALLAHTHFLLKFSMTIYYKYG